MHTQHACPAGPAWDGPREQLRRLVELGLIRELYKQRYITSGQFEQLMRLRRSR